MFVERLDSIRGLSELRTIHLDGTAVRELSPLKRLTKLTTITANDSPVRSLDALKVRGAPEYDLVEAKNTCVTDNACQTILGAAKDCRASGGSVSCDAPRLDADRKGNSFLVRFLDDVEPPSDLPIWRDEDVNLAFRVISDVSSQIQWEDPSGNCDGRANQTVSLLGRAIDIDGAPHEFPKLTKVVAFGHLIPSTPCSVTGFVSFSSHIAAAVRTSSGVAVLDPAFAPNGPVSLKTWLSRLVDAAPPRSCPEALLKYRNKPTECGGGRTKCFEDELRDQLGVELDEFGRFPILDSKFGRFLCSSSSYFYPPIGIGICEGSPDEAECARTSCRSYWNVDASLNFVADEVGSLRAYLCDTSACSL